MQQSLLVRSSLPLVMLTKYYQDILRGANSVLEKGKKRLKKKKKVATYLKLIISLRNPMTCISLEPKCSHIPTMC